MKWNIPLRQNGIILNWFWRGAKQHWHGEIEWISPRSPPSASTYLWMPSSPPHLCPNLPFYPTLPRVHPFLSVSSAAHLHFTALFYVTNVALILFYIRITAVQGLNLHQRSLISESNNKHVPTRKLRYFCKCQILLTPCVQFFKNQLINMLSGSFKAHVWTFYWPWATVYLCKEHKVPSQAGKPFSNLELLLSNIISSAESISTIPSCVHIYSRISVVCYVDKPSKEKLNLNFW